MAFWSYASTPCPSGGADVTTQSVESVLTVTFDQDAPTVRTWLMRGIDALFGQRLFCGRSQVACEQVERKAMTKRCFERPDELR